MHAHVQSLIKLETVWIHSSPTEQESEKKEISESLFVIVSDCSGLQYTLVGCVNLLSLLILSDFFN